MGRLGPRARCTGRPGWRPRDRPKLLQVLGIDPAVPPPLIVGTGLVSGAMQRASHASFHRRVRCGASRHPAAGVVV